MEVTIAREVALLKVPPHAQPVVHALHGQMNVFRRLQLDHSQPALARNAKQIQYSAPCAGRIRP